MALRGTDPESCITEHTLVDEEKTKRDAPAAGERQGRDVLPRQGRGVERVRRVCPFEHLVSARCLSEYVGPRYALRHVENGGAHNKNSQQAVRGTGVPCSQETARPHRPYSGLIPEALWWS